MPHHVPSSEPYVLRVAARDDAVPVARRRIVELVGRWSLPLTDEALRDIEVVASEVITNAVVHTGSECRVAILWTGLRLRVEVRDLGTSPVRPGTADRSAESGRGLLLVAALAACWGVEERRDGKTVWFEIGPSGRTREGDAGVSGQQHSVPRPRHAAVGRGSRPRAGRA